MATYCPQLTSLTLSNIRVKDAQVRNSCSLHTCCSRGGVGRHSLLKFLLWHLRCQQWS